MPYYYLENKHYCLVYYMHNISILSLKDAKESLNHGCKRVYSYRTYILFAINWYKFIALTNNN